MDVASAVALSAPLGVGLAALGSAIGIGAASGFAIMISAIYQGMVAASAIQASAKKPAIFGKCFASIGIIESFALFAFVFALLLFS